jgi:hypothetical protein
LVREQELIEKILNKIQKVLISSLVINPYNFN